MVIQKRRRPMLFIYLIGPAIILVPIGVYLFFYFKRMLHSFGIDMNRKIPKRLLVVATIFLMAMSINTFSIVFVIVMHLFGFALVVQVIYSIAKRVKEKKKKEIGFIKKIYESGLVPVVLVVIVMIYGYWNIGAIVEKDYQVITQKNIQEDGYKIAMLSDLHYGTTMGLEKLESICKEIGQATPDFVILCGDITDEGTSLVQMQECMKTLGTISNKYGIFYVYGNHDRETYSSQPNYSWNQLEEAIASSGIHILSDEKYTINNELVLVGREDAGWSNTSTRKSVQEMIADTQKDKYILVLDHQPIDYETNSKLGCDLQLSGHTHGGQIWPIGQLQRLFQIGQFNYGRKTIGTFQGIVTSGIGGWGYPIRTGSRSEWIMVTIEKKG